MSGYLKVVFEGIGTQKLIGLLDKDGWLVNSAQPGLLLVEADAGFADVLSQFVWNHNGGMLCVVTPLTAEQADQYM